jgi:hypothetical protein
MLSALLCALVAALLLASPSSAGETGTRFSLTGEGVTLAQVVISAPWNGQEWVINGHRDGAEWVAWLDTTALPPFTELRYVWSGVRADMSSFETLPEMVEVADDSCDWLRIEGARVTVFVCDESPSAGQRALDVAERQLDVLAADLGLTLQGMARLVLTDQVGEMSSGTAYTRYGVMMVARDACACDRDYIYNITIPHEVAHLAFARYPQLPVWFVEGLAMWTASLDLTLPEMPFMWEQMQYRAYTDAAGMLAWYAQSASLVQYIECEYGVQALLEYFDTHPRDSIEDALRSVAGLNSAQVMQEWRIDAGFEVRPRKQLPPDLLRWIVIGLHLAAIAWLSWMRARLRLGGER